MRYLEELFNNNINTKMSNKYNLNQDISKADMVIGAVLIPGAESPKLITEQMVKNMKDNSVIVDVSIDQGGCVETTHPTTHENPVFKKHGVIHYSVSNMPGVVARTSTYALTNSTFGYALDIANKGYKKALKEDASLLKGLNVYDGKITYKAVAETFDMKYYDPVKLL